MSSRPPALWEDARLSRQVRRMLPVSVGLHGGLLLVVTVWGSFGGPARLPPPSYEVALIAPIMKGKPGGGAPKRVDPPPAPTVPGVPPPEEKQPSTDASKAPDDLAVPDTSQEAARSREEALARLKREQALKRVASAAASSTTPSEGGAPATTTGGSGEGEGDGGVEYGVWGGIPGSATYEQQLQAIVNQNWLPPTWIDAKDPKFCRIRILIGYDGKITAMEYEERSGDASFDASAMAALRKSDPLPPPPLETKRYLSKKGLPLLFDSRTKLAVGSGGPT